MVTDGWAPIRRCMDEIMVVVVVVVVVVAVVVVLVKLFKK